VGILKHLKDVPEAANDPCIDQLYCNIFKNEIRPVLADVPGTSAIDMEKYQECIVGRFKESQPDDLCRMIDDTSAKIRVQVR
jgi:mannitol-1-phosphate/altronate dehydrogenase